MNVVRADLEEGLFARIGHLILRHHRALDRAARRVDQNIQPAVFFCNLVLHAQHRRLIRHIAGNRVRFAAARVDFIRDLLAALQIAPQHDHRRAAGRQRPAEHAADAAVAARHQRNAIRKIHLKRNIILKSHVILLHCIVILGYILPGV